ncbi:uncharacterized protein LOC116957357 [Petromyzon marinus]|nr:uncharacterized protein LOC116957357 isoform X2 [Petromyzon marinus]XP_032835357.1 uncharacterized protein LOC116957357 isoform X2 [Petromyzon marinus]
MHHVTLCGLLLLVTSWPCVFATIVNKVVYKFSTEYEAIWNDRGSGAAVDVSIWRPSSLESGFYPLGDVAVTLHEQPKSASILVRDSGNSLVRAPISVTEVWNDRGSGADRDVTVYRLNPLNGFTCLGHVAVASYSQTPSLNAYRCVNSSHVTQGRLSFVWNDRGSGATRDVSFWSVENDPMLTGITAGTFISHASHSDLGTVPAVLDANKAILSAFLPTSSEVALVLYNTDRVTEMWNDKGSGGKYDVSIWRAQGCCSLGDIAMPNYGQPKGILLRETIPGTLRKPLSFERIWTDRGSGADRDVSIWKPICPPSYHALGFVAEGSHGRVPSVETVRCVNTSHVLRGDWQWVYDDTKTGSSQDVTIWKAVGSGQTANTFKAVTRHGAMDTPSFILNPRFVSVQTGAPVAKVRLVNFIYDFESQVVSNVDPLELTTRTIAENCRAPPGSPPLNVKRKIDVTVTMTSSWSVSTSLAVGVEVTFEAGIPLIAKNQVKVSTTLTRQWEKTITESKSVTDSLEATIDVQAGKSVSYVVTGRRYIGSIPWKATMMTTFEDGSSNIDQVGGIFEGMQVSEIRVSADAPLPCG